MPNISVCVVARNAERTYKRLFESLREFADRFGDMVLVDTGSTDDTRTIYKAFGFRVYPEGDRFRIEIPDDVVSEINRWADDNGDGPILHQGDSLFNFSEARNYAASLAKNDYILNPDADEALTMFDIDKVEMAFGCASRLRYDFVFSHNEDGSPDLEFVTDTRASDRRHWKWIGHVHETNSPISDSASIAYVGPSVLKIEHWQVESPTRSNYLAGLAYACHIDPKNDRNSHYFGRELLYRGFHRSAIAELNRHISISTWPEEQSQSMVLIGDACQALGRDSAALDWYGRAFAHCSTRREPLMRLADYWYRKGGQAARLNGEAQRAAAYCSAALEIPQNGFYANSPSYYRHLPHEIMYWAKWWLGDKRAARDHWRKAVELCPSSEKYRQDAQFFTEATV